jgi:uncharacterized membrane protein (UPF0127 family)
MHMFEDYHKIEVKINDLVYELYVADTVKKRKKGLSQIRQLDQNKGMIFIFESLCKKPFTMKNTFIPLNIIFLDQNYQVVDQHFCKPHHKLPIVSAKKYKYVIEIQ